MTAFGTPNVLVVDADEDARAAAADALTASDTPGPEANVTAVASVEAARDALSAGDIYCLVTEYDFPEGSGLALVEWVRDTAPDVPCILYTDATPEEIRTAAFETVVVEYLPKGMPDSAVALSRLVGNVVSQHGQLAYPIPEDEDERLAAIEQYDVEGMEANDTIERITDLVAESFDVRAVFAGIVDAHEERFLACHGVDWETLDRENSICTHTILEEEYMIVEDVQSDARFAGAEVLEDLKIRSYAGVPLKTPEGLPIGALCLVHDEPRGYSEADVETLQLFAEELMEQLELRRRLAERPAEADR